jgi:hypothetical protein
MLTMVFSKIILGGPILFSGLPPMSKRQDKGRLGPFVALLKSTLDAPAWRAMSHGARNLYIALKRPYNHNKENNGYLYISYRDARKALGSSFEEIANWFRELQHYGFIIQRQAGCLGVDGKGKAPHWILTELPYARNAPTEDFRHWDGTKYKRPKKQNPATGFRSTPLRKAVAPLLRKSVFAPSTATESRSICEGATTTESRSILSLTTPISKGQH